MTCAHKARKELVKTFVHTVSLAVLSTQSVDDDDV
jgi:hypothetical protein